MLRTLLVRPAEFFEGRRDDLNGVTGGLVMLGFAVATTAVAAVVLFALTRAVEGTTTIPNPDRPSESVCSGESPPAACSEPAEVTVDAGALVWGNAVDALPLLFLGLVAGALLLAVVLYFGAKLARGSAGFGATVEITAWGLLPTFVAVVVGGALLVVFAVQTDLTVADPDRVAAAFRPIQTGLQGLTLLLVQVAGAAWQAFVWAAGLRVAHRLHRIGAIALAVIVATLPVVLL